MSNKRARRVIGPVGIRASSVGEELLPGVMEWIIRQERLWKFGVVSRKSSRSDFDSSWKLGYSTSRRSLVGMNLCAVLQSLYFVKVMSPTWILV